MLFLALFLLISNIHGDGFYNAINSCVFNYMHNYTVTSAVECAVKCENTDCKGSRYDASASSCYLFSYDQICQSNINCTNVTIFVNNRNNGIVGAI